MLLILLLRSSGFYTKHNTSLTSNLSGYHPECPASRQRKDKTKCDENSVCYQGVSTINFHVNFRYNFF